MKIFSGIFFVWENPYNGNEFVEHLCDSIYDLEEVVFGGTCDCGMG
jgi:hypothetical protein